MLVCNKLSTLHVSQTEFAVPPSHLVYLDLANVVPVTAAKCNIEIFVASQLLKPVSP